jgi:integrase
MTSFNARAAAQLQPDTHLLIDDCPGLRLEARQNRKTWAYRYNAPVTGNKRRIKIGEWPAMPLAAAMGQWDRLRNARNAGGDPAVEKRAARQRETGARPQSETMTVKRVCDEYVAGYIEKHRKPKSAREVARMFRTKLGPLAAVRADSITRSQAFDLLTSISGSPVIAGKLRAELAAAYEYAIDGGRLSEGTNNYWAKVMRKGELRSKGRLRQGKAVTEKRVLSNDEVGVLLRWAPHLGTTVADAIALYLCTGTRGSEIMSMEVSEMRVERGVLWWTIPKAKTKNMHQENATDMRVPLIGPARQIVERRMASAVGGFLFPAKGGRHLLQKIVQTRIHHHQPYCKTRPQTVRPRLPVTHWAPHDLRRTARTMLAAMDCPNEVAEAILGHVQPGVQGRYNLHQYDEQRLKWLTALSTKLEQLAAE